jgi:hypothetical protein
MPECQGITAKESLDFWPGALMKSPNNQPETADQQAAREALETAIRDNLSPEGVAAIIAFPQPATMYRAPNEQGKQALLELE